jgi:hypothetical protein
MRYDSLVAGILVVEDDPRNARLAPRRSKVRPVRAVPTVGLRARRIPWCGP